MRHTFPALLLLTLGLAAPASADQTGTAKVDATFQSGPGAAFAACGAIKKGERLTIEAREGDWLRLDNRAYVLHDRVRLEADKKSATVVRETPLWSYRAGVRATLLPGARLSVAQVYGQWMIAVNVYLPRAAVGIDGSPADALGGRWTTSGSHSTHGAFSGEVSIRRDGSGFGLSGTYRFSEGKELRWTGRGRLSGATLHVDLRYETSGLAGALDGAGGARSGRGSYRVRERVTGGWQDQADSTLRVRDGWTRAADETGTVDPGTGGDLATSGKVTAPERALAVPGSPEVARQQVSVEVKGGKAQLALRGPARLLRDGTQALASDAWLELGAGSHSFALEGTGDGTVTFTLKAGQVELSSGSTQVAVERLYLLLFGYQGTETHYLQGDCDKTKSNVTPSLTAKGYVLVEDGSSYDQSKIDKLIDDPRHHRKVVVDWCTTRDDLLRYLKRGTVRGLSWGSHGFMEPWIGCPDDQLDLLESRVWSAGLGRPEDNDKRNFVRELREALAASVKTHGRLDFALMHSCCTGGIGSYADEVWHYTFSETLERAKRVLGDPLPPWNKLRYNSFDQLKDQVGYLKTYVGPSYFGLGDVNWYQIRTALNPER